MAPSPADQNGVFIVSPYFADTAHMSHPQIGDGGVTANDLFCDGKAIMNDFMMLTTTGHCTFESLNRRINQRMWSLNEDQIRRYFESMANELIAQEINRELLEKFAKGDLTNLSQALYDGYMAITKNVEVISSSLPSPIFSYTRSPWNMFGSVDVSKPLHSLVMEDRRWLMSPSMGMEMSFPESSLLPRPASANDAMGKASPANPVKANARKKTVSALNRMKEFVVHPKAAEKDDIAGHPLGVASPYPGDIEPQRHEEYAPNAMAVHQQMKSMVQSQVTPTEVVSSLPAGSISPDISAVVCRRKKPKLADKIGPKGISKTGSTWRVQVQIRGMVYVDYNGTTTERKKYRFSRYIADYIEALWMYEVAILLSDRPKDLSTQMENGNYALLLEERVVTGPDNYYMELGIHVSWFIHSDRNRDSIDANAERIQAIQAYDAMKPANGYSLLELGQSIVNLGPVYSTMSAGSVTVGK